MSQLVNMISCTHKSISRAEAVAIRAIHETWLDRLIARLQKRDLPKQIVIETCQVEVERCFVPCDTTDEHPLFFLDVGGTILILFSEWMYDSFILKTSEETFERWDGNSFFRRFDITYAPETGNVLELQVKGEDFVPAERLAEPLMYRRMRYCERIPGCANTLIHDLRRAGIVE